MRRGLVVVAALLCGATAGCSPSSGSSSGGTSPTPSTAVSTPAPAPATPRIPTAADDAATVKRALVTPKDLGKPWIQPKAVSTVPGKKGEVCPGHVSAVHKITFTAQAKVDLTEGKGTGRNIGTFSLRMLPTEDDKAVVAAYEKDQQACADYTDANGLFVTRTLEGPKTVDGAEVVSAWAERVYTDQAHTELAYARHSAVTRQGRAVTFVSYAFVAPRTDPAAQDFTRLTKLLTQQVEKTTKVLG